MLDLRTQSRLCDSAAAVVRSALLSTTGVWAASVCKGWSLCGEMLAAGAAGRLPMVPYAAGALLWPSMANWMPAPQLHVWSAWVWLPASLATGELGWTPLAGGTRALAPRLSLAKSGAASRPAAPPAFCASYRSAGGHAVAQIVAPAADPAGAPANATASPLHAMLGMWRATLGA